VEVTGTNPGTLTMLSLLSKMVYRRASEDLIGISQRHYLALHFISGPEGLPQQQLSESLWIDANNTVLLLNELEREDLIRRERDPVDRRRHRVHLTETGARRLAEARRRRETLEDEVLAALDPDERETLHQLLAKALGPRGTCAA
jgi:MarR family transcriptional regulator, lower aerobic nicotinate degradation pathway regulator